MVDIWGELGTAAGKTYSALDQAKKPQAMADLKRLTKLDDMTLAMAVGWLAREEKVSLDRKGTIISVKLK
ncbi:MAG: winged helix-turn-helix domain-containing protein [Candidatus Altiarchaeota archaeon]